ncbi:MAG: carbohydrate ABC transporter permease [Clostridia bacterium]
MRQGWIRNSRRQGDLTFDLINVVLVGLIALLCFYPMYLVAISAFSSPSAVYNGQVLLWPKGNNWAGIQRVLQDDSILRGYANTIYYTALGTTINVLLTMVSAFVLSRKQFALRKPLLIMTAFTMFFGGGMIPTFLLIRDLKMLDSVWSLVLPGAISTWNLIIARTFITMSVSDELQDAASIDGCNHLRFFLHIVLPVSSTIVAVLGLFYAVGHWNSYWSALLYIRTTDKYPLQMVLRDILLRSQISAQMLQDEMDLGNTVARMYEIAESVKYVVVLAACLPILLIFPFVEKYFVKGVMIGSIKG